MRALNKSKKLFLCVGQFGDVRGRRQQNQAAAVTAFVDFESGVDDANNVQVALKRFFEVADALLRER